MEDSSFIGFEAASASFGRTSLGPFSCDLRLYLIFLSCLFADRVGRTFPFLAYRILLNLRKLGVMVLCLVFYCTRFI